MRRFPWILLLAGSLHAQPLSLQDAVHLALDQHPSAKAAAADVQAASQGIRQARAGYLPRISYSESWTRSNNPVFVFSSLLTQRQFTESNFAINTLNRPGFLNNFQSQAAIDQSLYDWGATRARLRSAELQKAMAQDHERGTRLHLIATVAQRYFEALIAQAAVHVAEQARRSAQADSERAQNIRDAGMSTDADVLSIRVHLAAVKQEEIQRQYGLQVALAGLNEILGRPLDSPLQLPATLAPIPLDNAIDRYQTSIAQRPDLKLAAASVALAEQDHLLARSALRPRLAVRGIVEANRQEFVRKGGFNWTLAASLQWNLFDGFQSRARIAETSARSDAAQARQTQTRQAAQLDVMKAWAAAKSAQERLAVADATVSQAEESLRITKIRFENGMTTANDLIRTEAALLDARTRKLEAIYQQRVAATQLELASGTLSPDSEVLR